MITIGLIVAAAAIALGVAKAGRLPVSVLAIAAGLGLRLVPVPVDEGVTRDGLLLAATFLVFMVGAEIDRRPLRALRPTAFALTGLSFAVAAGAGAVLWATVQLDGWAVAYVVLALGGGSTSFVFDTLRRRERFFEPIGRLLTATTITQDAVAVVALAGLAAFTAFGRAPLEGIAAAAGLAGLAAGAAISARWIAPAVMLRAGLDDEERLLFVLLVLFGFAAVARWTGNPLVVGAYFGGLGISRFRTGGLARAYLKSFADFFTVLFYVALGVLVAAPEVAQLLIELALVVVLLLVRPFALLPIVRRMIGSVRSAVEAVLLLAPVGELAVIVALAGMELGHVDEHTLSVITAVVVVTSAAAPLLSSDAVVWRLTHAYPFGGHASLATPPRGHVLLLGCGQTGAALLSTLEAAGVSVVVVDDDPEVVSALEARAVPVLRGDAADPAVLEAAGAEHAEAVVSTLRRPADNERLLAGLPGVPVLVRVFSGAEAERITRLGGHPVAEAEVAAEALLDWSGAAVTGRTPP